MSAELQKVVLSAKGISKAFGGVQALDEVSLELRAGEVHCLAGENGCGKSTLIKAISGALRPDSGVIEIDGESHDHMTPAGAIHAGIQVIYQDFSLFSNLTVAENITMTAEVAKHAKFYSARSSRAIATEIIQDLGVNLDIAAEVGGLSVADRQLTAICRALASDARVMIMDEPTTALTRREVDSLFETVRKLQARGVAMVFVSHKLEEALAISQRLTVLRNGRHVITDSAASFTEESLSRHMTGRDITESGPTGAPSRVGETLLEVSGLGLRGAFADVDFSLGEGEVLGITGLLGSGRSEIVEAIFGVIPGDRGAIAIQGRPVRIATIADAVAAGIAYVPGDRLTQGLFLDRSIADNIIAAAPKAFTRFHLFLSRSRIRTVVQELFSALRIKAPDASVPVRSLSGGNAQRVVIAKWLATHPKILILNGPTVGVDVGSKQEILEIIRRGAGDGMGVIVVSDDVPELVAVCHRVLIVREGRIATSLSGGGINAEAIYREMAA